MSTTPRVLSFPWNINNNINNKSNIINNINNNKFSLFSSQLNWKVGSTFYLTSFIWLFVKVKFCLFDHITRAQFQCFNFSFTFGIYFNSKCLNFNILLWNLSLNVFHILTLVVHFYITFNWIFQNILTLIFIFKSVFSLTLVLHFKFSFNSIYQNVNILICILAFQFQDISILQL